MHFKGALVARLIAPRYWFSLEESIASTIGSNGGGLGNNNWRDRCQCSGIVLGNSRRPAGQPSVLSTSRAVDFRANAPPAAPRIAGCGDKRFRENSAKRRTRRLSETAPRDRFAFELSDLPFVRGGGYARAEMGRKERSKGRIDTRGEFI